MDFQRYNDGVGLIAQNKISAAIPSCPLCGEHNVQWEIAFDFKGNLICILAKCPVCGAVIKTIFDFANNAPITSFTVSQIGTQNVNAMNEKGEYYVNRPQQAQQFNGVQGATCTQTQTSSNSDDDGAAGWGLLGFFIPIVGFILWLVWKNDYPKRSRAAGIGCLVSVCVSVVAVILYFVIIVALVGGGIAAGSASLLPLATLV